MTLLAVLVMMAVSAFANTARINGYRTGEVSDLLPTGFTPAGWVFSIWSVIYVGLLAYAVGQLAGPAAVKKRGASIRGLVVLNAALNVAWIFAWHHMLIGVSCLLMFALLGTLVAMLFTLQRQPRTTTSEWLLVDAPISLYFGWITTATIANIGAFFASQHVYPFGLSLDQWALVSVVGASMVYVALAVARRDVIATSVFVWAALGIALKPVGVSVAVKSAASTGAAVVVAALVVAWTLEASVARGDALPRPRHV